MFYVFDEEVFIARGKLVVLVQKIDSRTVRQKTAQTIWPLTLVWVQQPPRRENQPLDSPTKFCWTVQPLAGQKVILTFHLRTRLDLFSTFFLLGAN